MKGYLKNFFRSFTAVVCAIIWATAFPLQMTFAAVNSIPKAWWGLYDTDANPRYTLIISKGTSINFRGRLEGYGRISASYASSIYFQPVTGIYKDNFVVTFEKYATYNETTQKYEPKGGPIIFIANANTQNSNILVKNGNGDNYSNSKHVDKYVMYA